MTELGPARGGVSRGDGLGKPTVCGGSSRKAAWRSRSSSRSHGTKLYVSTIKTLNEVFPGVHLYPTGEGEVITVAIAQAAPADSVLKERAAALQKKHGFRYPLPDLMAKRIAQPSLDKAELLTDDFAPVNLYDQIGREQKKRK